jgi:hypothetical protein
VDLADSAVRAALRFAAWRKSRYSNPSGECVEFARLPARSVAVRDSRSPHGGVLVFTDAEWEAFLAGVRGGDTADSHSRKTQFTRHRFMA